MSFKEIFLHYLAFPDILYFFLIAFCLVFFIHIILFFHSTINKNRNKENSRTIESSAFHTSLDKYYELMFSSTSVLFFIGLFFTLNFPELNAKFPYFIQSFWQEWSDFLLLGFIIISILINNLIDHHIVPIKIITKKERNILRMAAMLYMLFIFAYIKFIYKDSNYDEIIFYFLTLVIGRFVYFDADLKEFIIYMKEIFYIFPYLILVLLSSAILAFYGFGTGYLLRTNGVVTSLFLAHFFAVISIFLINLIRMNFAKKHMK